MQENEILWEPYSYDEMKRLMDDNGMVVGYVQVPSTFAVELQIAVEKELSGYYDAGEELYEELAEMVIGNEWCYDDLYFDIVEDDGNDAILKVEIKPDLTD